MNEWYSFYSQISGLFASHAYCGPELDANTPEGFVAIKGRFDLLSQRVDLQSGEVVDYQPPSPDEDHEWNPQRRRWVLSAAAQERLQAAADAANTVKVQESGSLRAIRELLLDPSNADARARLQAADDSIAAVRPVLAVPGER